MPSRLMLNLPERGRPEWGRGSVYFVGTATVILRYAGFTILTDPNFLHRGQRAYVGMGLTTRRLTEPALSPSCTTGSGTSRSGSATSTCA